jgi:pyruvate/2-oxoglutarate dehydrogenase complex dihydrolipoamide acyltransferase (E2) component
MKNISCKSRISMSAFQKIAIGSWLQPRDPSTYISVDVAADSIFDFIQSFSSEHQITMTHLVAKITGHCLQRQPCLNSVLIRNRLYIRKSVDVFISAAVNQNGKDISGFAIKEVDTLSVAGIAAQFKDRLAALHQNEDPITQKIQERMSSMPPLLLKPFFKMMNFIQFTLNLAPRSMGIPKDRCGSVIITNIGAIGLKHAFSPLPPFCRCPFVLTIGKPYMGAIIHKNEVRPGRRITFGFTIDRRYVDSYEGAKMIRRFEKILQDPWKFKTIFD